MFTHAPRDLTLRECSKIYLRPIKIATALRFSFLHKYIFLYIYICISINLFCSIFFFVLVAFFAWAIFLYANGKLRKTLLIFFSFSRSHFLLLIENFLLEQHLFIRNVFCDFHFHFRFHVVCVSVFVSGFFIALD